jgi:hypothetical protein
MAKKMRRDREKWTDKEGQGRRKREKREDRKGPGTIYNSSRPRPQ